MSYCGVTPAGVGMHSRWARLFPIICVCTVSIMGILLLADFTLRLAMLAGPFSASRFQGNDSFWLPWLQTRLAHATGLSQDDDGTRPTMDRFLQVGCPMQRCCINKSPATSL